jgi:hypothetical protein
VNLDAENYCATITFITREIPHAKYDLQDRDHQSMALPYSPERRLEATYIHISGRSLSAAYRGKIDDTVYMTPFHARRVPRVFLGPPTTGNRHPSYFAASLRCSWRTNEQLDRFNARLAISNAMTSVHDNV